MADILYPLLPRPPLSPSDLVFRKRVGRVLRLHRAKDRNEDDLISEDGDPSKEEFLKERDDNDHMEPGSHLDERV